MSKGSQEKQIGIGVSVGVGKCPTLSVIEDAQFSYDARFGPQLRKFKAEIRGPGKKYLTVEGGTAAKDKVSPNEFASSLRSGNVRIGLGVQRKVAHPLVVTSVSHSVGPAVEEADACREEATQFLSSVAAKLRDVCYVPAIRGFDQPSYELIAKPSEVIVPGRNAEVASTFAYGGRNMQEIISEWSESITGSRVAPRLVPGRKIVVESDAAGGIPICGDGFGTNQLVQLLLTVAMAGEGAVVAIEEPEIHLHPKAQKKLCEVLVSATESRNRQLVVTTHSQHILYAFLSAVRSGSLEQDGLAIWAFQRGGMEPHRVDLDDCGDIYGDWDKDFFGYS